MSLDHLSYSNLALFMRNPLEWKRRYMQGERYESNDNMAFGSAFHETIAEYKMSHDVIDMIHIWDEVSTKHLESREGATDLTKKGLEMLSLDEVQTKIDDIQVASINDELAIEYPISLHVPNIPLPFTGFIDVIEQTDSGLLPIDFKTTSKRWGDSKIKALTDGTPIEKLSQWDAPALLQCDTYLAALNQAGLISFPAKFKFLVFVKKKKPEVQEIVLERGFEDIYNTFGVYQEVWGMMEKVIYE